MGLRVEEWMTRLSLTPLSPQQEIALRRIAHGSLISDDQVASKLLELALIERASRGWRLTPLGRLRYDALPKAPLLTRPRSLHAVTGYVEGLIEKAQSRAQEQGLALPGLMSASADDDGEPGKTSAAVVYSFFDSEHTMARAQKSITRVRRLLTEHKQREKRLCDASLRRIELSQLLLKQTVPVRPPWLVNLQ
jgi:hypothetical protein